MVMLNGFRARVRRQDQFRVDDDVADVAVVAAEADPSVHSSHIR